MGRRTSDFVGLRQGRFSVENVDEVSALAIQDEIKSSIINFEPRVNLLNTKVVPNPELNEMNVTIEYEIVGIDIPPQQLDFVLLPVR